MLCDPASEGGCDSSHLTDKTPVFCALYPCEKKVEGSVCAAWAQVIGAVLAWYDRNDPVCAQLLRLRYLQGLPEEKVIARLYVGRTTYYTKELEALSTVAVCAADAGLLPGGQMSGVF